MSKAALALGFTAYIVFGTARGTLAAYRADSGAATAASHDPRVQIWSSGTNARLVFTNERLYPDTAAIDDGASAGGTEYLIP
jgi:hypothetical protein